MTPQAAGFHVDGTARFQGRRAKYYSFTLRRRVSDGAQFVVIREFRIEQEPRLKWVRTCGLPVEGGYLVPLPDWEDHVDAAGELRPAADRQTQA